MRTLLQVMLVVVLLAPSLSAAKIYKKILPDGSITYSDQPQESGAEEVSLPPLQTYTPPPMPRSAAGAAKGINDKSSSDSDASYDALNIVSPKADESMRENSGSIGIQLEIKPALRVGHVVEIAIDGNTIASGRQILAIAPNLARGSHTISATIKNRAGKVLATAQEVTFHLQRTSLLQPGRAAPPTSAAPTAPAPSPANTN